MQQARRYDADDNELVSDREDDNFDVVLQAELVTPVRG